MDFPCAAMALDAAVGVRLEGVQVVSQGASEEHRLLEDGFMDPLRKFRRKSGKSLVNLMEMLGTYYYSIFWGVGGCYVHICVHIIYCIYIYLCVYRERERKHIYIHIYVLTCI